MLEGYPRLSSRKLEAGIGTAAVVLIVTAPELIKAGKALKERISSITPDSFKSRRHVEIDLEINSQDSGDSGLIFSSDSHYSL